MEALSQSADVFEAFFDQAQIGLALADLSTRYVRVNEAYAALLGRAPEDLIGLSFAEVMHPDERLGGGSSIAQLVDGRERSLRTEEAYVGPDGRSVWVLHGVTVVPDGAGAPAWFAVSAQDITERRAAEQDLRALTASLAERAVRDPLTGLANRTLLEERLRASLARDARTGASTGVLFLDLDGFKSVNDRHGHAVGDAVLCAVAKRLSAAVRPSDTVGRLGGDEFVVLVENATAPALRPLVRRLRTAVGAEIVIEGLHLDVGVSIGIAVAERGERDAAALLGEADRQMYEAKRGGSKDPDARARRPPRGPAG